MRKTVLAAVLAAGCASAPTKRAQPVFYPPLPNAPRLQYLASFSSAADVGPPRSGFATFVAGEDPRRSYAVQKPYGAAIAGGKIYLSDMRGGGYAVFDLARREYGFVTGTGNGRLRQATSMAVGADGTKYVADVGQGQVLAFDREDRFVRAYGVLDQFKPGGVAIAGDRLYVTDLKGHDVQVLDRSTGARLLTIGRPGAGDGEFHFPTNVAIGPGGELYVSDLMNFRVQRFTPDGRFVRSLGTVGTSPGQFARPKGVAVDRDGRVYVVDAAFENVQIFDRDGRLLLFFGAAGNGPEGMNLPTAVIVDYENVEYFRRYLAPGFELEYLVLVVNQFGQSKLNVYGFGRMAGADYGERAGQQQGP